MLSVLECTSAADLERALRGIKVDPYGIRLMAPKGVMRLVLARGISNIAGNILKQEMLGLGGDAAVCKGALTGAARKTDCLLMGTLSQFSRLQEKLRLQPFGLAGFGRELAACLAAYGHNEFKVPLPAGSLKIGGRPVVMGILNATPDSFSGDGLLKAGERHEDLLRRCLEQARLMVSQGAGIIDVGGESSRPGSRRLPEKEELSRVLPVVRCLARELRVPVSIDTYKPEVARRCLDAGASIINDIRGMRDAAMRKAAARGKAGVVVMHMRGTPRTMQAAPAYRDLVGEISGFFQERIAQLEESGVKRDRVIIDPGIGFGKTVAHNFQIIRELGSFRGFGCPVLVGPSRKSFIGAALSLGPGERLSGTVAACIEAARRGAAILRVHDVAAVSQALAIAQKVEKA